MSKFSERTFNHWKHPASENEEQRISNAIKAIKEAIKASEELKTLNIDVFVQGSYANHTNVRAKSDVDICIMLKDTFHTEYPDNLTDKDYGFTNSTLSFSTFRKNVFNALLKKFGNGQVKNKNKSIKINSTAQRIDADAVPSLQYRNYRYNNSRDPNIFEEGIKFISLKNEKVINYPKIHIENGKLRNSETMRRYKRLTRILKRVRYQMIADGINVDKRISSFLIECLVWNIPDSIFNNHPTWTKRIKHAIIFLYNQTKNKEQCKKWTEVSGMLPLFGNSRKWDEKIANNFLRQLWVFLDYKS